MHSSFMALMLLFIGYSYVAFLAKHDVVYVRVQVACTDDCLSPGIWCYPKQQISPSFFFFFFLKEGLHLCICECYLIPKNPGLERWLSS